MSLHSVLQARILFADFSINLKFKKQNFTASLWEWRQSYSPKSKYFHWKSHIRWATFPNTAHATILISLKHFPTLSGNVWPVMSLAWSGWQQDKASTRKKAEENRTKVGTTGPREDPVQFQHGVCANVTPVVPRVALTLFYNQTDAATRDCSRLYHIFMWRETSFSGRHL